MTRGPQTREGGIGYDCTAAAYASKGADMLCLVIDLDA